MKTSIIITNYNYGRYVARAIRSCLDQTEPVEIIVVDDASTDDSVTVIKAFSPYIKHVQLLDNVGIAKCRNAGITEATGQYVMFLDADDCIHRDTARILGLYLDFNTFVDAVESDHFIVDEGLRVLDRRSPLTTPIACGVMYRTEVFKKIGGYNKVDREDIDFRTRFIKHEMSIAYIDIPLYRYRYHGKNAILTKPVKKKQSQISVDGLNHIDCPKGQWSMNSNFWQDDDGVWRVHNITYGEYSGRK